MPRIFQAEIERQLATGSNEAADLVLRKGDLAIAVEISVTTTVDHEFGNVRKCLDAGLTRVAVVSTRASQLLAIKEAVQAGLGSEAAVRVTYHTPDGMIAMLQELATLATKPEPPTENIVEKIEVGKGEVTLTFCYLPTSKELAERWRKGWDSNPR